MQTELIMDQLNLKEIVNNLRTPNTGFVNLLNQAQYRYVYLLPVLYGLILALLKTINDISIYGMSDISNMISSNLVIITVKYFILFNLYALIVFFISRLFGGIASMKMTTAVASYSLIPLITGLTVLFIIKLGLLFLFEMSFNSDITALILYIAYLLILSLSIILLTIGNSIASDFSIFKSFLSTSVLIIGYTVYEFMHEIA